MGDLHAIIVTFRRPQELESTLVALLGQTHPPKSVLVVDNEGNQQVRAVVGSFPEASYIAAEENGGPAGGLALGFQHLVRVLEPNDWVLFVDDDDPPTSEDALAKLIELRDEATSRGMKVGAVGLIGARYSRALGRSRRLRDSELSGLVGVDAIGGGQLPIYSMLALSQAGPPAAELFFGSDDLELGLRIRERGFDMIVDGDEVMARRRRLGKVGLGAREAAAGRPRSSWRRYYASRNAVVVARRHGGMLAAILVSVHAGIVTALVDFLVRRDRGSAESALRGVADAWGGRLGRRVEPE